MMFKKAITLFTAGVLMAGMIAGTGSIGVMAAEKTPEETAKEIAIADAGVKEEDVTFDRVEIGTESAIEAALSHAGLTEHDVTGLKCEKDTDDGREIYEVEFRHGGYEYEYEIDANDYSVLEWDRDYDD